jgi:hypothetical protein
MSATYPGLVLEWTIRHPLTVQDQAVTIAKGKLTDLHSDQPNIFRLIGGQTGYLKQLQVGFRLIADPNNVLSLIKGAMVTIRFKRASRLQ